MSDTLEMERLVEVIADRVRSRLGDRLQGIASPSATPSFVTAGGHETGKSCPCGGACGGACGGCGMPKDACAVCGIHALRTPAPGIAAPQGELTPRAIAQAIDHTHLKPEATRESIETICREAREHGFFSVCVNSSMVSLAASQLSGSKVKVCAVVGFPLGAGTPGAKAYEAREAVRCGADEIDMVLNIGALKSRDYELVEHDINKVVKAVQPRIVKVILETGMLNTEEKIIACALSKAAGAQYVKTSTGFGPGGATAEDIQLMRRIVGPEIGVKASGGVRDLAGAVAMLKAGASRIGASSSVAIVTGGQGKSGY